MTLAARRSNQPIGVGTGQSLIVGNARRDLTWDARPETRIQLLGRFRVTIRDTAIEDDAWPLRKARTLVKLLALAPNYRLHREQVMEQLWPDLDPRSASHNLRVTLHAALQALGEGPADPHRLLARVGDELILGPASPTLTDVEAFEAAAVSALTADEPAPFHDALDLYAGDLLPEDRYEDAFAYRRRVLRDTRHEVIDGLVRLYEADEDYEAALAVVQEALAHDPASRQSEALYVSLMRLHLLMHRPDLAARRYASLAAMLRREFGAEPGEEARALQSEVIAAGPARRSPLPSRPRHEDTDEIPPLRIPPSFVRIDRWGRYGKRQGEFDRPTAIAVDALRNAYVTDLLNHRIQVIGPDGAFVREWGGQGSHPGSINGPMGISIGPDGTVYVADQGNHRIQRFAPDGTFIRAWGQYGREPGAFDFPYGVAADTEGNVYVAEVGNARIQKFSAEGELLLAWGSKGVEAGMFDQPASISTDRSGHVYVTDGGNHRIQKFSGAGEVLAVWGQYGTGNGEFRSVCGVTADPAGDVYVSDAYNLRIQKFASDGRFLCRWGRHGHELGEFGSPRGLATDGTGSLYVADAGNNRIERYVAGPQLVMRALPA